MQVSHPGGVNHNHILFMKRKEQSWVELFYGDKPLPKWRRSYSHYLWLIWYMWPRQWNTFVSLIECIKIIIINNIKAPNERRKKINATHKECHTCSLLISLFICVYFSWKRISRGTCVFRHYLYFMNKERNGIGYVMMINTPTDLCGLEQMKLQSPRLTQKHIVLSLYVVGKTKIPSI